jgi:putative acetyltransferase
MIIRDEVPVDVEAIRSVVTAAFDGAPHANGSEAAIVDALRANGALTLSLVAEIEGEVVGYVAYSPVSIDGRETRWFGLGPIAVMKSVQRRGIGKSLIDNGLGRLATIGAHGCVVLGDPVYYGRFGFESDANLRFPGVPEQYFQRLLLSGNAPIGVVKYNSAFY